MRSFSFGFPLLRQITESATVEDFEQFPVAEGLCCRLEANIFQLAI
jgi:hypothetical protein